MRDPVNIMLLCNNEMALPAMQHLYFSGALKAVVVPEENVNLFLQLQQILTGTGITLTQVNKKNLRINITDLILEKQIFSVWIMTFPYIIPGSLLKLLPDRFINFHYGILPKYRGPNPILAQMLNDETESGISIHVLDENIDTGPIILQQMISIEDNDTFGLQLKKLSMLGASMAVNLLEMFKSHDILPSFIQDETKASYFKNPVASDLMISWNNMMSGQIIRLVNACNPWNKGAGTFLKNMGIRITDAELSGEAPFESKLPGTILSLDKNNGLKVYCSDHKIIIINVINTDEGFFAGHKLMDYGIQIEDRFISL